MFPLHMCSGKPVEADCWQTKSSGDCSPSPIGKLAFWYRSPAFFIISISSAHGISRKMSRARWALRMSRLSRPGLA